MALRRIPKKKKMHKFVNEAIAKEKIARMEPITMEEIENFTTLDMIDKLVERSRECKLTSAFFDANQALLTKLADKFHITSQQALMLAVATEYASGVDLNDVSTFFACTNARALTFLNECESMRKLGIMRKTSMMGMENYVLTKNTNETFSSNAEFVPKWSKEFTAEEFVEEVETVMNALRDDEIEYSDAVEMLKDYFNNNTQLPYVTGIKELQLKPINFFVLVMLCQSIVVGRFKGMRLSTISQVVGRSRDERNFCKQIADETNELQVMGLIEFVAGDGMALPDHIRITDKVKDGILSDYDIADVFEDSNKNGLLNFENLVEKELFYNEKEAAQISRLQTLLSEDQLNVVRDRLKNAGMRTGFTCLFYGSPGTGKTETVYQLARQTGRCIMEVDVDKIKNKFVGESEKNIREVFDQYRRKVKDMKMAPILLFNEADAIIGKRLENVQHSVDQMNNAIQNIILQEMEKLDGIMIATTNLTSNLDKAFERRFLYKVKFDKPSAEAKSHIWKSMISDLSDEQALQLASRFDFSGGQIENVSRKHQVNQIINGDALFNFDEIISYCEEETLGGCDNYRKVGF